MTVSGVSADISSFRIVILISVFERGGSERQAYLLARELRQRHGLDVEVWALMYPGKYASEFEAIGVPTGVVGFRDPQSLLQWPRQILRVVRHLRQGRIDVLLPFTTWPNVVAGLTYRLCGVRLCIWGERSNGRERVPGVERFAARQYQRFVANSTASVEFLAGEMRIARKRISLIPNGVDAPEVSSGTDWRAKLGLQRGQLLVVKIANITSFKDHATLLHAWKIVQDSWLDSPKPILALAGFHGDRYEECQRISQEAGLDPVVRFLGSISDVPTLVRACDVAAFSSLNEGMPNGVLECMAAGKAIVASDLPGVRDALGPNIADVLVPPGDSAQFARNLLDLLCDKGKRDALGEANKARIRAEFSAERMAKRYLKIIKADLPNISGNETRAKDH